MLEDLFSLYMRFSYHSINKSTNDAMEISSYARRKEIIMNVANKSAAFAD